MIFGKKHKEVEKVAPVVLEEDILPHKPVPEYKDLSYTDLAEELLVDIENLESDYERFINERKAMLPLTKSERDKIEAEVKLALLKMWKNSKALAHGDDEDKGFFRYEDIYAIPYIQEYFNIVTANGDRNIGKSRSLKRMMRDEVSNKMRFMLLRMIDDEVSAQVESDEETFLAPNNWSYKSKKMPNIFDWEGRIVGWYRALNTSAKFKSIDFPDVGLLAVEEFNEVSISHKYLKLIKMISTVQRFNPNLKVILQANFVDQNDEILQALGLGSRKLTKDDFAVFNWEVGAIIINIPKGVYRQPKDAAGDVAYRGSLGDYDVWKAQYGGGFSNEEPVNIIDEKTFSSATPIFNIYTQMATTTNQKYGAYKMTLYHVYDSEGKMHNVLTPQRGVNNAPVFVYDYLNKIKYPTAQLITQDALEKLIYQWNIGNLKTTNIEVHGIITVILAKAKQALDRQKVEIEDIENMVL